MTQSSSCVSGEARVSVNMEESHFVNCPELTSVVIADSVEEVGYRAIYYCPELASVSLGSGITSLNTYFAVSCDKLNTIIVNNNYVESQLTTLGYTLNLDTVVFGGSVTELKSMYLWPVSMTFGGSIKTVPDSLMAYSTTLTNVQFGNSVTKIGSYAFCSTKVKSLEFPDSIKIIGSLAFSNCENLETVSFGKELTTIGASAFSDCAKLKTITIPERVTSIGDGAFIDCLDLESVTICGNLKNIGSDAFTGCPVLSSVVYKGTTAPDCYDVAFDMCPSLDEIQVPDNYEGTTFAGKATTKKFPPPTEEPNRWFVNNIGWMAPTVAFIGGVIAIILKYDDVKAFCIKHCCNKEENTEKQDPEVA